MIMNVASHISTVICIHSCWVLNVFYIFCSSTPFFHTDKPHSSIFTSSDFAALWFSIHSLFLSFSFILLFPSSPPLLLPCSLDAEQTQCSLCKITRLIKANKQTTALRQLQMKANLYTINRRRSSFNLAHTAVLLPSPRLSSCVCSLSASSLCCWAGLKGKGKLTDASIIHRSPLLSLSLSLVLPAVLHCVLLSQTRVWGNMC